MVKRFRIFGIIFLISISSFFFSCASSPKKEKDSNSFDYSKSTDEIISIPVPLNISKSFFSSIDNDVIKLAENGSGESLKQVYSRIHKTLDTEYTDQEKILLATCYKVLEYVWPSQKTVWDVPSVTLNNPYTGALDSVEKGMYDYSTGNSDFLTLVLPSVVLVTSENKNDYYESAEQSLNKALSMNEDSVLAVYLTGVLYYRMGEYDKALERLIKVNRLNPDVFEIQYYLSKVYYQIKDYKNCLLTAKSLLDQNQMKIQVLEMCLNSSYFLGNYEDAEMYVSSLSQIEPENMAYVLYRAKIFVQKKDYIRASSWLDVYSRNSEPSKDYLLLRSQLQSDWNKNYKAAGETVSEALSMYPDDYEILLRAADIASKAGMSIKSQTALEMVLKILEKQPYDVSALRIACREYYKIKDYQKAYEISRNIINSKECKDSDLYFHVEICLGYNKSDEGWSIASSLYEKDSSNEDLQQLYIKVLLGTGKKTQALSMIETLLPVSSNKMKSFLYLEQSYLEQNSENVLGDLRKSLTANPRNKDSLFRLYQIYYNRKDWKTARYYLKQVIAIDSSDESMLVLDKELDVLITK